MTDEAWNAGFVRSIGVRLVGDQIDEVDERGHRIVGDTMLLLLNAHGEAINFTLPKHGPHRSWERVFDTAEPWRAIGQLGGGKVYELQGRSMAVFRMPNERVRRNQ